MNYRSTNAVGYVHFSGDVTSHVGSSHGVQLTGGSTGGIVQPAGDDSNISLTVRGLGTGAVTLGNSSSPVQIGASSSPIALIQKYTVQFTEPDVAASTYVNSTYTVSGLTTNSVLIFTPHLPLAAGYSIGQVRCSTADELVLQWQVIGGSTASGSSNRGTLLQIQV